MVVGKSEQMEMLRWYFGRHEIMPVGIREQGRVQRGMNAASHAWCSESNGSACISGKGPGRMALATQAERMGLEAGPASQDIERQGDEQVTTKADMETRIAAHRNY